MSSPQANNFFYSLFGFERAKGKSTLLLLVLVHISWWCFIFLLPFLFYHVQFEGRYIFLREALSKIALVGLFYLNYYYLLPRFFEKKRYVIYFSFVVLFIALVIAWDVSLRHSFIQSHAGLNETAFQLAAGNDDSAARNGLVAPFKNIQYPNTFGFPLSQQTIFGIPQRMFLNTVNRVTSFALILLLLGGLIRLGASLMKNQNEKKILENANLNAEVSLLKSQINPHFLFNTLNSIYALAHERSEKTETAILKLSELLRYMLYQPADEKVELSKEINYITNYIQLQQMRLSSKIKIEYEAIGKTQGIYIIPFLLIIFIENAFKHGVSYAKPGSINIKINVFEKTLTLFVENPWAETDSFTDNGLGLKNAKRRLDLLYPGKYILAIDKNETTHTVNFKLELSD
ncbi:MAG TPA: histidine kinase [Chitinophagaceae bacterium]|nr:histidine kinase [Chitinophagaceae bacterium]